MAAHRVGVVLGVRQRSARMSGGMQQPIPQSLATGADFLIADEPTTALDVSVGAQVLALLRKLVVEPGPIASSYHTIESTGSVSSIHKRDAQGMPRRASRVRKRDCY
jgi:ABC-type phosphate/phosphonate transport system ATPase subunit